MGISTNPFFKGLSGSVSIFTVKQYKDKIVVCRKIEKRKAKTTPAQRKNEKAFALASQIASYIYADPVKREEARLRLKAPHGIALYRAILKECRLKEDKEEGK